MLRWISVETLEGEGAWNRKEICIRPVIIGSRRELTASMCEDHVEQPYPFPPIVSSKRDLRPGYCDLARGAF